MGRALEKLKAVFPSQPNLAPLALRWILLLPKVGCIIPGASQPEQLTATLQAGALPSLTELQLAAVRAVYERRIRPLVHQPGQPAQRVEYPGNTGA